MNKVSIPAWLTANFNEAQQSSLPDYLLAYQQTQWDAFVAQGLPTRKHERFKYTNLSRLNERQFILSVEKKDASLHEVVKKHQLHQANSCLIVLVNGFFNNALSVLTDLPQGMIVSSFNQALHDHAELIKRYGLLTINSDYYPFASINGALAQNGFFLYIPPHCTLTAPIHILSLTTEKKEFAAYPKHLMIIGDNSKATFFEEHVSLVDNAYLMNSVSKLVLGKTAQVDYCKLQNDNKHAIHLAHLFVEQQQDSQLTLANFTFGGEIARDDVEISLQASGATCKTAGFYHLQQANQYVDNHLDIKHQAPHTYSEMLYKGIVDSSARAVFNGRLYVQQAAQKIIAYQANHNLLLSKQAEVYSKPELEIYADDVKCKHGASIGQIDEDALFYLRSRGIEKSTALQIILQGFADEVFQRIYHKAIRARILGTMP